MVRKDHRKKIKLEPFGDYYIRSDHLIKNILWLKADSINTHLKDHMFSNRIPISPEFSLLIFGILDTETIDRNIYNMLSKQDKIMMNKLLIKCNFPRSIGIDMALVILNDDKLIDDFETLKEQIINGNLTKKDKFLKVAKKMFDKEYLTNEQYDDLIEILE